MTLRYIGILPQLTGYIDQLWIYENSGRVPDADMKLIVPNGSIKLIVPFRNGISGTIDGWSHLSRENSLTLIGMCDRPSVVDVETDNACGTIGVSFSPLGAYRFFRLRHSEIRNRIHILTDILGNIARDVEQQIANATGTEAKVLLLQRFLLRLLSQHESDPVFDYCIQGIRTTKGRVSVKTLEQETGYSSRWLNMKFDERVGISPKNLSSIIRFQQYYQALAANSPRALLQREIYSLYYDQSHFIREFKRFTGLPPSRFEQAVNDFGKIFYKR